MMRLFYLILFVFLSACQTDSDSIRTVDMYNRSGDMIGTAVLVEQSEGVEFTLKLEGLEAGFHGIHVHEYPNCEGPDFLSAGNHLNPEGKKHGHMHPEGAHLGDLPNVEADSSGSVDAELMLSDATLLDGKGSLVNKKGTSLIIQEDLDDGMTQPGGDAGARIACGKIDAGSGIDTEKSPTDPAQLIENEKDE